MGWVDKNYILKKIDGRYTVNEETGCWIWNGTTESNRKYYPQISINCTNQYVYRVMAYAYSNVNNINNLGSVAHSCKNKRCINPDHLEFNKKGVIEFSHEMESAIQMYMEKTNISSKNRAVDALLSIGIYNFLKERNEI
jgi:hypothetical protein